MAREEAMATFIMVTRLNSAGVDSPQALEELEKHTMGCIRKQCPDVEWMGSYAALGPYDYVDIFRAADIESATKVTALMRTVAHAHTEVWPVTEWGRFKQLVHGLSADA
jgi:uncharacterized protein with GYD domain